ncbi:hypothetical protein [Burkholderia ubonensis]|nr:hypothetical protein [Burkholderia ubonensis]
MTTYQLTVGQEVLFESETAVELAAHLVAVPLWGLSADQPA